MSDTDINKRTACFNAAELDKTPLFNFNFISFLLALATLFLPGCVDGPPVAESPGRETAPEISAATGNAFSFLTTRALNGNSTERRNALAVLVNSESDNAFEPLRKSLATEPDRFLRRMVIQGMIDTPRPWAVDLLKDALKEDDDDVNRVMAAYALAKRADTPETEDKGIRVLISHLKEGWDPEPSDYALGFLRELSGKKHPYENDEGRLPEGAEKIDVKNRRAWKKWWKKQREKKRR